MKIALTNIDPGEISRTLALKRYQGRQIFRWIHQKQVFDFDDMTDLSKSLRQRLKEACVASRLRLAGMRQSPSTGTKKALFRLTDGETIESVLIHDRSRLTLCLSSQVGCPLGCTFCATGLVGFKRNLDAGEIVEQALYLVRGEDLTGRTPNIVYMGMGEPFLNYEAVMRSIRLLMSPDGLGIGARKITVSTAGEAPQIERFAAEQWQVRLSVSLHGANNKLRSTLVPLNRRYPLERLRKAIEAYLGVSGRRITFEWTLMKDVNDSPKDAEELAAYARGLRASINLIPQNPVSGAPYEPPPKSRCEQFRQALEHAGLKATLRREKGQDIDAACGQLRRRHGVGETP